MVFKKGNYPKLAAERTKEQIHVLKPKSCIRFLFTPTSSILFSFSMEVNKPTLLSFQLSQQRDMNLKLKSRKHTAIFVETQWSSPPTHPTLSFFPPLCHYYDITRHISLIRCQPLLKFVTFCVLQGLIIRGGSHFAK